MVIVILFMYKKKEKKKGPKPMETTKNLSET
jgi:hypothetical protein